MDARLYQRYLKKVTFGQNPVNVAVSGGADSAAMAILAAAAGKQVVVWHIDHGLRETGDVEAQKVEGLAKDLGAEYHRINLGMEAVKNLEETARKKRKEVMPDDVATGHTLDDQAETVLLRLSRGTGVAGLGAMVPGPQKPILALRRKDTEDICAMFGYEWVEDPTNTDPSIRRNRVRRELLPLLNDIGEKDVAPLLSRVAESSREAWEYINEVAKNLDPCNAKALAGQADVVAKAAIRNHIWKLEQETRGEHALYPEALSLENVLRVAKGLQKAADIPRWRVERHKQKLLYIYEGNKNGS